MKTNIIATLIMLLNLNFAFGTSNAVDLNFKGNLEYATAYIGVNDSIILLNGEKWKIDDNMMEYIREMENSLKTFNGTTTEEYNSLAKTIEKNTKGLTSSCTMKGQAHDEVHKWLIPYLKLTKDFKDARNTTKQKQYLNELKASFIEFNAYFK